MMKLNFKFILHLLLCTFSITLLNAQNKTDEGLAAQYFNNQEYDKAVIYYEKLLNQTNNQTYYNNLLTCFIELKEFKNGEKLIKRQLKHSPLQLAYYADLGHLYQLTGDSSKAEQTNSKALKLLAPIQEQIITLANGFLKYQENNYAVQTYLKGRKLLKDSYPFNFELAQVYNLQGKTEAMLTEYLDILAYQESYLQSVQNALQTALTLDDNGEKESILKTLLIKNIQKNPDKKVYAEMLIWVYIQEQNYNGAFIQAKALDRRNKEYGNRIVSLANLALSNKKYDAAIQCYQYLIEKGPNNYYYNSSKMSLVNVYNEKIISSNHYTQEDLVQLEKTYESTINELGKTAETALLLNQLAHLQAFYLNEPTKAIDLLIEAIAIPRTTPHDAAKSKLELADIYLFTEKIWDASLLYSQVEKEFKYDQLGEIAKFKNAKISFYTGDFGWAKAQLDVLKASTSKLIANDAMQLSILITDNIGVDTTKAPLMLFAQADMLAFQNKNEAALHLLDSLKKGYPYHAIADDILFKRYEILYKQKKYEEAIVYLKEIITSYSTDILADDALYKLALIYDYQLNEKEKAAEYYRKIMFDYQGSIYVVDARKRYRELEKEGKNIKSKEGVLEFKTN